MRTTTTLLSLSTLFLTGCATSPLPEDFTGKATYEIVRKIRCEARDAVRAKAIALMLADPTKKKTYATGLALREGRRRFTELSYSELDQETVESISVYVGTVIAYDFTFDITEQNNNSATLNFKGPIGVDVFSLGFTSAGNFSRGNMRNFAVADTFGELATKMPDRYCEGLTEGVNAAYPITGDIGLAERVDTFLDLNQSGGLTLLKSNTMKGMADTLKFTTVLTTTVTPKIELKTPGTRLTDAGLTSVNSRTDLHQVVIALKLPEKAAAAPVAAKTKKSAAPTTVEATKLKALELIEQQYNRAGNTLLRDIKSRLDIQ